MANQWVNKVIVNGDAKIDLTNDNITLGVIPSNVRVHLASGEPVGPVATSESSGYRTRSGTAPVPTSLNVTAAKILSGYKAIGNSNGSYVLVTGNAPDPASLNDPAGSGQIYSGYSAITSAGVVEGTAPNPTTLTKPAAAAQIYNTYEAVVGTAVITGTAPDPSTLTSPATAGKILSGYRAITSAGVIVGSCNYDAYTGDANAAAAEILNTKTAYVSGTKITGNMPNRGAINTALAVLTQVYTIPNGYHDGSGKVAIDSAEQTKLIPNNIREGVTVLGVEGTMSGSEGMHPESKTVTPSFATQTIEPTSPTYNCLSSVVVNPIPVSYTDNTAGGQTCTIG